MPASRKRKRNTSRRSWVWDHLPDSEGGRDTIWTNNTGELIWRCKLCPKAYKESAGTRNITQHLETHSIYEGKYQSLARQATIHHAFERGQEASYSRRHLNSDTNGATLDPGTLEQLVVRWITSCNVSFRMVEKEEFRTLLEYINPDINTWLPSAHATIQGWILRAFQQEKEHVKLALQSAISSIHFTLDLWTSPNAHALLGIVSHYTNEQGALQQSVLAMKELRGEHSGENLASVLLEVVEDYQIISKIGYMMMDNAENNNTMMTHLSASMILYIILFTLPNKITLDLQTQHEFFYDPKHFRLRCNGHIINLSAQSFLFDTQDEALAEHNNTS